MVDQRIRIHADGEFGALKRQLKGLESDFGNFQRTVNKGANQGGMFSKQDLAAFDIYRKRYQEYNDLVQKSISEQIQKVRQLENARKSASDNEKKRLTDEINLRKQLLNQMRGAQGGMSERYDSLNGTASGFGALKTKGSGGGGLLGWLGGLMRGGVIGTALSALGMTSLMGTAMRAYQESAAQNKYASDLLMRVGGSRPDFRGSLRTYRGLGENYGYNGLETMMGIDNASSRMGAITNRDASGIMGFTRAFGLDLAQQSDSMGRFGQLGAAQRGQMQEFANILANTIDQSGMTARAAEAVDATKTLIEQIATRQPGNIDSANVMALQTVMNKTGLQGFMGARGADVLTKLGDMFNTSDSGSSMFINRSLGMGKGKSYYDVMLQRDLGLSNSQNLPGVLKSVGNVGVGLSPQKRAELQDFTLQQLTGVSLQQAKQIRESTHGYSDLSAGNISAVSKSLNASGTIDSKVAVKNGSLGQITLNADAKLTNALAHVGDSLLEPMAQLKEQAAKLLDKTGNLLDGMSGLSKALLTAAALIAAYSLANSIFSKLLPKLLPKLPPGEPKLSPESPKTPKVIPKKGGPLADGAADVAADNVFTGAGALETMAIGGGGVAAALGLTTLWSSNWERGTSSNPNYIPNNGVLGGVSNGITQNKLRGNGNSGASAPTASQLNGLQGFMNGGGSFSNEMQGVDPFDGNYKISSPFGDTADRGSPHHGLDFAMPTGTKLPAMLGGTVDDVGSDKSRGKYVRVKTANGDMYTYMHMSDNSGLMSGAQVQAGQVLGLSGATGDATGPHLHIGYQQYDKSSGSYKYIDPESVLSKLNGGYPAAGGTSGGTGSLKVDVNMQNVSDSISSLQEQLAKAIAQVLKDNYSDLSSLDWLTQPSKN